MIDAMDIMEIVKPDAEEKQWQYDLISTIERIHYKNSVPTGTQDELSHFLQEPKRKPHFTLDFTTTFKNNRGSVTSPLETAIDCMCYRCLRTLLVAGASASYSIKPRNVPRSPLSYLAGMSPETFAERNSWNMCCLPSPDSSIGDMINELLIHGADINAGTEKSRDMNGFPALTNVVLRTRNCEEFPLITQLLDKGAHITQFAWHFAVGKNDKAYSPVLRVLIKHADEHKQVIPLHALFERLPSVLRPFGPSGPFGDEAILQIILRHGYIPDKNSGHARQLFVKALKKDSLQVVFMMLNQSPMMLQACRGSLQGVALSTDLQSLLDTPPSLQNQCKGVIKSTIGHGYLDKVKQLTLPPSIIEDLATVKDTPHA